LSDSRFFDDFPSRSFFAVALSYMPVLSVTGIRSIVAGRLPRVAACTPKLLWPGGRPYPVRSNRHAEMAYRDASQIQPAKQ
jgi:hypothetical protein